MKQRKITAPAKGEVKVANDIVEKIARLATSEVDGVADFASSEKGFKQVLNFLGSNRGIKVEVGSKEVAVDIDISVEYGTCIPDIVKEIRRNVTNRINEMTGLEVVELNIRVNDLHFPRETEATEPKEDQIQPRVR